MTSQIPPIHCHHSIPPASSGLPCGAVDARVGRGCEPSYLGDSGIMSCSKTETAGMMAPRATIVRQCAPRAHLGQSAARASQRGRGGNVRHASWLGCRHKVVLVVGDGFAEGGGGGYPET